MHVSLCCKPSYCIAPHSHIDKQKHICSAKDIIIHSAFEKSYLKLCDVG